MQLFKLTSVVGYSLPVSTAFWALVKRHHISAICKKTWLRAAEHIISKFKLRIPFKVNKLHPLVFHVLICLKCWILRAVVRFKF
jgi:hypothetical protein